LALEATSRRDPNKLVLATNGHFDAYGKAFDAASGAARDWFQQDLSPVTVATTAQQRQAISSKGRRDDHGHLWHRHSWLTGWPSTLPDTQPALAVPNRTVNIPVIVRQASGRAGRSTPATPP
jgi:hypothetical protein